MNKYKTIGELIKLRREELELSQDKIAEELKVSKSTISLYESGDRKPTLARIYDLARILKMPVSAILEFDVPNNDINIALRSEGIVNKADMELIKTMIKTIKEARSNEKS